MLSFKNIACLLDLHERVVHQHFFYFYPRPYLSNYLLRNPNEDHMHMLHARDVDVPTYHFKVHKIVHVSSSRVIFIVHHR